MSVCSFPYLFYFYAGTKVIRGMTENPNETLCSTQFYNQIKRELTNSACTNDVALCLYNGNDAPNKQLTDSNLKYNVQVVLENLRKSAEKTYLNNKATTNNNNNSSSNNIRSSSSNQQAKNITKSIGTKISCDPNQEHTKIPKKHFLGGKMSSPESDCNSNVQINPLQQLATSIASSHDFTHDNSDYQWFLDYK